MRRLAAHVAIVAIVSTLFVMVFQGLPSHQPYFYDEADYVSAASQGFVANILERPSMSTAEFIRTGLSRNMQSNRASLSDIVRSSRDITFYRHYHGPVYFYWLAAVGPLVHFDEYAMRTSGLLLHVITFEVIYFGVLLLSSSPIAALIASFLFLFGQSNIDTDTQVTPHGAYVLFTVLTLLCFSRYLQNGNLRAWYVAVAAFTAAFCSVEYAILLPVVFVGTLVLVPSRRLPPLLLFRSVVLFLCCFLVLWPMGLLKLSAIKGYLSISYLAVQRTGVYGDGTPLSVWVRHMSDSPPEYIVLIFGSALFLWSLIRRRAAPFLLPLFGYALLMLLTTLKNRSLNSTYVSSILPALSVLSGIAIASVLKPLKPVFQGVTTLLILLFVAAGGYQLLLRREVHPMYRPETGIIAAIRGNSLETANVLVPSDFLPALSFYFPKMRIHGYLKNDSRDVLLTKMHNYGATLIIGEDMLLIRSSLIDRIHVKSMPIYSSPGYSILQVDGYI